MFSLSIPQDSVILFAVMVLCTAFAYIYGLRAYIRAARFSNPVLSDEEKIFPKASVVVYASCSDELLEATVDSIMLEDYPDFEVIVVCDASGSHASMLNERFAAKYENVYVTFIQPGSHNLSRRKLAVTLGVKAAKGDVIVTTAGNIELPGHHHWLSEIMTPFCGEQGQHCDVSLGLSEIRFEDLTGPGKWYRQFDSVLTDGQWIGYAAAGHPYRGDNCNLAFRRSVFLEHKGYAKTIYLHNGDDDLFICEIADGNNSKVTAGDRSIVRTVWPEGANRVWSMRKEQYAFTSRWLPKGPFVRSWIMMLLQWAVPALGVAVALTGLSNLVPAIAAGVLTLFFWGMEIYHYRRLAARLGAVKLWWAVVPFWLWRPIGNLFFDYDRRKSFKKNYTWQR